MKFLKISGTSVWNIMHVSMKALSSTEIYILQVLFNKFQSVFEIIWIYALIRLTKYHDNLVCIAPH